MQSPGYVTIVNEMVHESRVVPLDGRPHIRPAIGNYLGDSRGRWDGDTLVVETTNFTDRMGVGMNGTGASDALKITERFSRTSDTTLQLLDHHRRPEDLDRAVHDAVPPRARRRVWHVRIRVPRG